MQGFWPVLLSVVPRAKGLAAALALWLLATAGALADQATGNLNPDPTGEWMTEKRYATIRIADCDGHLWGVVASETTPSLDFRNPDPKLRQRPTLGLPVLLSMTRTKPNKWDGKIYNSEDGHTYTAGISVVNPNTLRVEGCFLGFLCGGENWTRVEPMDRPGSPPGLNTAPFGRRQISDGSAPNPAEYVCLNVFGPAWLAHQRGLK
jgi:uncharacterized protein (DUF2147 family)